MNKWFAFWVLIVVSCTACAPALKDLKSTLSAADSGNIWFASTGSLVRSPDGSRFITGEPVVISGELRFPSGAGPFPAVILAHGCGGISPSVTGWEQVLRSWGYATFVLDSFRGRGLTEVCTDARTLAGTQRIPDAYGALRILATHPRIDVRRVALMGFSHGGILTMGASTVWAKETYAPAGQPAFRAFLPFYPYCNTVYPERERVSAPLRIHTGELDDWTPAGPCARLADSLKASGQDVTITVYPGAHHAFDGIGRGHLSLPNVDSGADCALRMASVLGPFPPQSQVSSCLRKGATIAWNPEATEQARRNVQAQLAELLR
ncbi:MAG: dienelactone hydrolase family protein [Thermoanaerobaculia bacterium]